MAFGTVLRRLRESAGMTQADLAQKTGLSLRTIQSWEQGRRSPVSPDFFKVVAALGVDCTAFADPKVKPPAPTVPKPRGRPRKDAGEPSRPKKGAK